MSNYQKVSVVEMCLLRSLKHKMADYMRSAVLQEQPLDGAAVPLHPAAALLFRHQFVNAVTDPADVLGHLGVDAVFAFASAAFAPAHDTGDKIGVAVACDVRPAAVTLAGVLGYLVVAGTEHAGGDAQLGGFHAGQAIHVGDGEALQDGGRLPTLAETAEAADHAVRLPH